MKVFIGLLIFIAVLLQWKAWFSDVGYLAAQTLRDEVFRQELRGERLAERNRILTAEVRALKDGLAAVEARARSDLGMIRSGETFYLVNDPAR